MSQNITVADDVYARLKAVAQARRLSVEAWLTEFSRHLSPAASAHPEELAALAAGGLPASFPQPFADLIDPTLDYEAIRHDLASKTFTPPLSEIIIEDRG